jgi:DNA-binding NtrC family response regulator
MVKVLFIDDEPRAQKTVALILPEPYVLLSAYCAQSGLESVVRDTPDVVLLDINLPDRDGVSLLREIESLPCPPPVVMLTGMSAPRVVKEALLAGACDYLVKPWEPEELLGTLRAAVSTAGARRSTREKDAGDSCARLLGESAGMQLVKELVLRYAPSDAPVLVLGESGTGKELVAGAVHAASRRRDGPFVAVNCGALPESLLESELFGAEKGAFTDAVARPGCFERAAAGTLFLDEVGELSPAAQARLLRVIEQKSFTRVGGTRPVAADVRIVSATHRKLKPSVRARTGAGEFRPDLWYRLAVLTVEVPPLRERPQDIPLLAAHFLSPDSGPARELAPRAEEALQAHAWPGNVRELRNVLERARWGARGGRIEETDLRFD